jgi:hypothetical protein
LHAPAVPRMRGSLSQLRFEELAPGRARRESASCLGITDAWIALSQNGCQVGGDCNSPAGELRSAL